MAKVDKPYVVRTENREGTLVAALYEPEDTEFTGTSFTIPHEEWEALGSPRNVTASFVVKSADEAEEE